MRAHIALVHRALGYCLRTHDLGLTYRRSNSFSSLDRALLSLSHVARGIRALCTRPVCVCPGSPRCFELVRLRGPRARDLVLPSRPLAFAPLALAIERLGPG